jgi:hypothetical protein
VDPRANLVPRPHHTVKTTVEQGDTIATEFSWVATNTGPWILPDGTQLPSTGKHLEITGMVLTTFRDGKMAEQHMYWDNLSTAQQAGLLPASPKPLTDNAGVPWASRRNHSFNPPRAPVATGAR